MTTPVRPQRGLEKLSPYVPGTPIDQVKREYGLDDVIKLASNENPLGVTPMALAVMEAHLCRLNQYPDAQSYDLRHELADHFGLSMEQVTVGNGADDLILQLSMAYLDEGDEVIVSRSSFPMYDIYAHAMRANLVKTPLASRYRIDLEAMSGAVSSRTKLIYVCNPNNPTGTIVTSEEVESFLAHVPDHVLVVFDEAYIEMADSDAFADSLTYVRRGRSNVVSLRTFSKVYGLAGIRLGYAFGAPEALCPLLKIKPAFSVNVLAQVAGIAALGDGEFLARSVSANLAGRRQLCCAFERLGLEHAESHTNFVLVRIGSNATDVQQRLVERGVIVRPCGAYDLPEHLRVSIGTQSQNDRLIETLTEILRSSGKHGRPFPIEESLWS